MSWVDKYLFSLFDREGEEREEEDKEDKEDKEDMEVVVVEESDDVAENVFAVFLAKLAASHFIWLLLLLLIYSNEFE